MLGPDRDTNSKAQSLAGLLPRREGAFWVLIALGIPRVAGAMATVVLRRFLGPGIAGTYDLAYAPYQFLDNFRSFGTGPALIYERELDRETADTAWTVNMLTAVLITALAQFLAGPIARFYGHPQIEGIFRVLAIAYLFASFTSVHFFLLLRQMNFRSRAIPAIGQVITGALVAAPFAFWGFGVGALVAREVASVAAGTVLLLAVCSYRPRIRLVPRIAFRLMRYGVWIGGALTVFYLSQNADIFIGGKIIHKASDIGFYTTSWSLAFIVAGTFAVLVSSMVFPALSRVSHDQSVLLEKLMQSVRQLGAAVLPASMLLACVAPVLVVPLLGEKFAHYRASFMVLSLLAIYAGNRTMLAIFFEGYKSIGKPWLALLYNLVKLAVLVPAMIVGAQHGIVGLAATYIPIQVVEIPLALMLAQTVLHVSPAEMWHALRAPLIATAVMAATVVATERILLNRAHFGDLRTLAVCGVVGVLAYVCTLRVLDRNILPELRTTVFEGL